MDLQIMHCIIIQNIESVLSLVYAGFILLNYLVADKCSRRCTENSAHSKSFEILLKTTNFRTRLEISFERYK